MTTKARRVFVSHSSHDSRVALALVADLERQDVACWMAPRDIKAGSDYASDIVTAMRESIAMLYLQSRNSAESPHCLRELELAVHHSVPILPLRMDDAAVPPGVEYRLSTIQWILFEDGKGVDAIVRCVRELAGPLSPDPVTPRAAKESPRARRSEPVRSIALAGRESETKLIQGVVTRVLSTNRGGLLLVAGESGVGKSALIDDLAAAAQRDGYDIYETACGQFNESMSFFPLREIMRQFSGSHDLLRYVERTYGPGSAQASMAAIVDSPLAEPQARREAMLGTFANIVFGHSGDERVRPVLLLIDDLELIDPGSVDGLLCLLARVDEGPVLVAGAFRSDVVETVGRSHALNPLIDAARRDPDTSVMIRLGPIRREDYPAAVDVILGAPLKPSARLLDYLWTETEGNVLFLREILQAVRASDSAPANADVGRIELVDGQWHFRGSIESLVTPKSVEEAISRNLEGLEIADRSNLEMAAVIGKRFGFDIALGIAGLTDDELLESLEHSINRSIIRELENPVDSFEFSHGKVRDVLYNSLSRIRRKRIHSKIADLLAESSRASDHDYDALIGEHLFLAERYRDAAKYLERTADRLMTILDAARAAVLYERVLSCHRRNANLEVDDLDNSEVAALYLRRIEALSSANDYEPARALCAELIRRALSGEVAGWAHDYSGDIWQALGDANRALTHYEEAEQLALAAGSTRLELEVCADLAELHERLGERLAGLSPAEATSHRSKADSYLNRQYSLAEGCNDPVARARAFRNEAKRLRRNDDFEGALRLYELSVQQTDARVASHQVLISYAKTLQLCGRTNEANEMVSRVLSWSTQIGARRSRGIALHYRALLDIAEHGPTEEALTDLRSALALHEEIGYDRGKWEVRTLIGEWYARRGRWDEAIREFRIALAEPDLSDADLLGAVVEQLRSIDEKQRAQSLETGFGQR